MSDQKIEKLLGDLTNATNELVDPAVAERIKEKIPHHLADKGPRGSFNLIIDLRISKLAAAAIIILTMIVCANLLERTNSAGGGLVQDSKMFLSYLFGADKDETELALPGMSKLYEHLSKEGIEIVYYGDAIDPSDGNAVLMHWKVGDNKYEVVFADLRKKTVSSGELIKLQSRMLEKNNKKQD